MTRNEAKAMGLTVYQSGKPCARGHNGERYASHGSCVQCSKDRVLKWQKDFPEKANSKTSKWGYANRETTSKKAKAWAEANAERYKANIHAWAIANRARRCEIANKYRFAKQNAAPAWADRDAIDLIYRAAQVARVFWPDAEVDHVIPLQGKTVTGLHVHNNLQIITAKANRSKSNRLVQNLI